MSSLSIFFLKGESEMKGTVCLITGAIGGIVGMVLSLFWFLLGAVSFHDVKKGTNV